jgi:hypothetical protein
MDEWYNETYAEHGSSVRRFKNGHGKPLWTPAYERFMRDAAQRERERYASSLPQSGSSQAVLSPEAAAVATGTSWTNIGPTKANYEENGGSLTVTDSGRVNAIVSGPGQHQHDLRRLLRRRRVEDHRRRQHVVREDRDPRQPRVGALEMDPNNANTLYLGLGDPFDGTGIGMAKSTDGANTWSTPVFLGDSSKILDIEVAPSNSTIVLAATDKGLYRSTNSAARASPRSASPPARPAIPYVWSLAYGGGNNFALSLEANHAATTGTTDGQVWKSTDNGVTWVKATGMTDTAGVGRITIASGAANRSIMYAMAAKPNPTVAADLANLFKSTDGGATWTGIGKSGTTYKSYSNTNSESANLSTLLGGQGWYNHAVLVDRSNANIAYFGGQLLLAKTTDGGTTFAQRSNWLAQFSLPYVHADFHAAHQSSNGNDLRGHGRRHLPLDRQRHDVHAHAQHRHRLAPGLPGRLLAQQHQRRDHRPAGQRHARARVQHFGVQPGDRRRRLRLQRQPRQRRADAGQPLLQPHPEIDRHGLNFASACSGITECNNSTTGVFITRISQIRRATPPATRCSPSRRPRRTSRPTTPARGPRSAAPA